MRDDLLPKPESGVSKSAVWTALMFAVGLPARDSMGGGIFQSNILVSRLHAGCDYPTVETDALPL